MSDVERFEADSPVANHTLEKYDSHDHLKEGHKLWMHGLGTDVNGKRVQSLSTPTDLSSVSGYVALHCSSENNYNSRGNSTRDAPETILYDYRKYIPVYYMKDERESHVTRNLLLRHKTKINGAQGMLKRSKGLGSKDMQLAISDRTNNHPDHRFYGDDPFDSSNEVTTQVILYKPDPRPQNKHTRQLSVSSDDSFTSLDLNIARHKRGPKTDDVALIPVTTPPTKHTEGTPNERKSISGFMSNGIKALKSYFEAAGERIKAGLARLCAKRCQGKQFRYISKIYCFIGTEPLLKASKRRTSLERGTED
ncbi:hypothetical protein X943_003432 [Babesia divergens]|uniref:Uncharacterized protein n=1 Tax=Babesia divergens TaxID=32595 RepID=A0AAD9GFU6_BABDI|nr:hypothetical protein X943_003432 [Babesia divergens]